jgi:hypothetical protein
VPNCLLFTGPSHFTLYVCLVLSGFYFSLHLSCTQFSFAFLSDCLIQSYSFFFCLCLLSQIIVKSKSLDPWNVPLPIFAWQTSNVPFLCPYVHLLLFSNVCHIHSTPIICTGPYFSKFSVWLYSQISVLMGPSHLSSHIWQFSVWHCLLLNYEQFGAKICNALKKLFSLTVLRIEFHYHVLTTFGTKAED